MSWFWLPDGTRRAPEFELRAAGSAKPLLELAAGPESELNAILLRQLHLWRHLLPESMPDSVVPISQPGTEPAEDEPHDDEENHHDRRLSG